MKFKIEKSFVKFFLLMICFFFAQNNSVFSADNSLSNTGFIKSGLWYSKDPFYAGDKIRIYTIVFNGSAHDLIGDVEFDDNNKVICKGSFTATSGRTQELWCDWTATMGGHKITAKIVNSKIAPIGDAPRLIVLQNNISGISERDVTNAPRVVDVEEKNETVKPSEIKKETATSSSFVEEKLQNGLDAVQKNVTEIAPVEIKKEDFSRATDKILSYIPTTIKDNVKNIAERVGLSKIKTPLSYFIDFFVAVYKFIINDPLVIIIILFFIFRAILKYIYSKITKMY